MDAKLHLTIHAYVDSLVDPLRAPKLLLSGIKATESPAVKAIHAKVFKELPVEALTDLPQDMQEAFAALAQARVEQFDTACASKSASEAIQKAFDGWRAAHPNDFSGEPQDIDGVIAHARPLWDAADKANIKWADALLAWNLAYIKWSADEQAHFHQKWCGCSHYDYANQQLKFASR